MEEIRKMVFLYSNDCIGEKATTLDHDLNLITRSVNRHLNQINRSFEINNERKMIPVVECKSISDFEDEVTEYQNIRICLTKVNGEDYSKNYQKIIESFERTTEISHLISLSIEQCQTVKWQSDEAGNFDCKIELSLDKLENVLISIMLDMMLYKYFNLSSDIAERKRFSILKKDYILKQCRNLESVFANSRQGIENSKYLSLSYYKFVEMKIDEFNKVDFNTILIFIKTYWNLITDSIFKKIELREGAIKDIRKLESYSIKEKKQIDYIVKYFNQNSNTNLFAIEKDSVNPEDIIEINDYKSFALMNNSAFKLYNIIISGEGGDE